MDEYYLMKIREFGSVYYTLAMCVFHRLYELDRKKVLVKTSNKSAKKVILENGGEKIDYIESHKK